MYGIWNSYRKEWQFGICEPTEIRAYRALFKKIGRDAYKWRFEAKKLPNGKIQKWANLDFKFNTLRGGQ